MPDRRRPAFVAGLAALAVLVAVLVTPAPGSASFDGDNGDFWFDLSDVQTGGRHSPHFWTVGPNGFGQQRVGGLCGVTEPSVNPETGVVAYRSFQGLGSTIFTIDPDDERAEPQQVTTFDDSRSDQDPAWTRDGASIVFERIAQDQAISRVPDVFFSIVQVDPVGGEEVVIRTIRSPSRLRDPKPSPVDDRIVYARLFNDKQENRWEIVVFDPESGSESVLTNTRAEKFKPDWSPDGTRIVYQQGDGQAADLFIVDADAQGTRTPERLTGFISSSDDVSFSVFEGLPVWAPDGTAIAFVRELINTNDAPDSPLTDCEPIIRLRGPQTASAPAGTQPERWTEIFLLDLESRDVLGPLTTTGTAEFGDLDWQRLEPPPPTTTSTDPPRQPEIELDREVTTRGEAPMIDGRGFPDDVEVRLRWEPGLGTAVVRTAPGGTFRVPLLVLPNDLVGDRLAIASVDGRDLADDDLLVQKGTFEPGGFDRSLFSRG